MYNPLNNIHPPTPPHKQPLQAITRLYSVRGARGLATLVLTLFVHANIALTLHRAALILCPGVTSSGARPPPRPPPPPPLLLLPPPRPSNADSPALSML